MILNSWETYFRRANLCLSNVKERNYLLTNVCQEGQPFVKRVVQEALPYVLTKDRSEPCITAANH